MKDNQAWMKCENQGKMSFWMKSKNQGRMSFEESSNFKYKQIHGQNTWSTWITTCHQVGGQLANAARVAWQEYDYCRINLNS